MTEYTKLKNQPLKLVLAQFTYSPVLAIENYIKDFQDKLRHQYPQFRSIATKSVKQVGLNFEALDSHIWELSSQNSKNAIVINQESVTVLTAEYERFEGLSQKCEVVLEALSEIINPTVLSRVGLRYGDLIKVDEGEELEKLLDPNFCYPSFVEKSDLGKSTQLRKEILIETDVGRLTIKSLFGKHGLSMSPDLQGMGLDISPDNTPDERMVLDIDHIWKHPNEGYNFTIQKSLEILKKLHEKSRKAFWAVTTDYAREKKWK